MCTVSTVYAPFDTLSPPYKIMLSGYSAQLFRHSCSGSWSEALVVSRACHATFPGVFVRRYTALNTLQGRVTPIGTVSTAATGVKIFDHRILALTA